MSTKLNFKYRELPVGTQIYIPRICYIEHVGNGVFKALEENWDILDNNTPKCDSIGDKLAKLPFV